MKHVVSLTISNPSHEHVSLRRSQKTTNFVVEAKDDDEAILRASNHFRKLGNYVHEAKVVKPVNEEVVSENNDQINEVFGILSTLGKVGQAAKAATTATKAVTKTVAPVVKAAPKAPVKLPAVVKAPVKTTMPVPVKTTAPVPVKAPVAAPAPVKTLPSPVKITAPVKTAAPSKVATLKPMHPLVAAATVATGINYLLNKPKTEKETKLQPVTEPVTKLPTTQIVTKPPTTQTVTKPPTTQTVTKPPTTVPPIQVMKEPETPVGVPTTDEVPGDVSVPSTLPDMPVFVPPPVYAASPTAGRPSPAPLDLGLSGGLEDSGFLKWIRAGRSLSARQEMYEESHTSDARKNALTRVLEKRTKAKEEEMKGEKNKINMEPTLKAKGGMHNVKV